MMKRILTLIAALFLLNTIAHAEILEPVSWTFSQKEVGDGEYELRFIAKIDKGWYVYAQGEQIDMGPVPTSFMFAESPDYEIVGDIEEKGKAIEGYDKFFDMEVKKFKRNARFFAKVKSDKPAFTVKGSLEFMTCNDSECLPPEEVPFKFNIIKGTKKSEGIATEGSEPLMAGKSDLLDPVKWDFDLKDLGDNVHEMIWYADIQDGWYVYSQDNSGEGPVPTSFTFKENEAVRFLEEGVREEGKIKDGIDPNFDMRVKKYANKIIFKRKVKLSDPNAEIEGELRFMTCDDKRCLPPEDVPFKFSASGKSGIVDLGAITGIDEERQNSIKSLVKDCDVGVVDDESNTEGKSYFTIFFLGFIGGFAALLTPCVFPMIPMTVSFFTKQSKNQSEGIKNALIYALSIIVIYVGLGYLVTVLFGAETMSELSTGVWFNLAFFVIFVVFAFSFFGFFEITLPSWIVNKSDQASDKGGLIGIFFMAFTLALVSFSCTGPIIGTLLVEAVSQGSNLGPVIGMTGFAIALALPFAVFAAFPGWMNSMPKSGGWLGTVKVVLGFIELIFALKFLSNADMVAQWGLLKRETFLVIWIILFVLMGAYLFTWFRFKYDTKIPFGKLGIGRWLTGGLSFLFALYLIPGLFCGNIGLVSGFPPPTFYAYSPCDSGVGYHAEGDDGHEGHIMDLEKAMAVAKKEGKPLMIDFTGWACVNCRKMEENVWTQSNVSEHLNEYVIASLYVDEKVKLPEEEHFKYMQGSKQKSVKTVGNKWSFLEFGCYKKLSQPYYVLLNENGELLGKPRGYTPDVDTYADFLEEGLAMYKDGKSLLHN